MRTDINQAIIDALAEDATSTLQVRISGGRTRRMSWAYNGDYAPSWADGPGAQATPLAQDFCVVGGLGYTLMAYNGGLWICNQFSAPVQITSGGTGLSANAYSRPALRQGMNESQLQAFYCNGTHVQRLALDRALVDAGNGECVLSTTSVATIGRAALHAVGLDQCVALWVDDGGVRATYIDGLTGDDWWGRFMFPGTALLEADSGHAAWLNYSAAVEYNDKVMIYLSAPTGEVMGVVRSQVNGAWSDSFTAVPGDMSRFLCGKAVEIDGTLFLSGTFYRWDRDESFTAGTFYTLLLASTDGRTWALDRTTAVTGGEDSDSDGMALRFLAGWSETPDGRYGLDGCPGLIFSDANRWFAQAPHFGIDGVVDGYDCQDCMITNVVYGQMFDLTIPFEDNEQADQVLVGDVVDVYFGVRTAEGPTIEYLAARCLAMEVREAMAEGGRSLRVSLISFSSGKLLEMKHPFTVRKQGKVFLHDTLSSLENFDLASEDGYVLFPLACDFWGKGDVGAQTHNALDVYEFLTRELDEELDAIEFPEIEELPFDLYCYGWSRSGTPSAGDDGEPLGDDPSDADAPNDEIYVNLYIEREGEVEDLVIPIKTAAPGYVNHFPQTWKATEAGDYPVVLRASTGLQEGDRIKKIGLVFSNTRTPDTAETVFVAERVEMPTVMVKTRSFRETWAEILPPSVDKTIVIARTDGMYYTENGDVDSPTWHDFNDDLDDAASLDSACYDSMREYYYAVGPSGIWRAEELGGAWTLVWEAATAVTKLVATGWTIRGRLATAANGSEYSAIHCAADGTIFVHGGETPATGDRFTALFRSTDGLATLEPVCRLIADGAGGEHCYTHKTGQIVKLPGGRVVATFACGYGVGSDSSMAYSDANGEDLVNDESTHATRSLLAWYARQFSLTNSGNRLVYYFGGSKTLMWGEMGYTHETETDVLPADTANPAREHMRQSLQYSRTGGRLALVGDNDTFYVNAGGDLESPTAWTLKSTLTDGLCVGASKVSSQAWWAGDGNGGVRYSEDDGATWQDRSGDLASGVGSVQCFVRIGSGPPTDEDDAEDGQALQRIGIPVIEFAQEPYYALGCEVSLKAALEGENAFAGVVLLASDGLNYIVARASLEAVELMRVRAGVERTLASAAYSFPTPMGWVMARYQDGVFRVYVKSSRLKQWALALEYEWTETDGALLADDLISHVGLYALNDSPYVKICGLDLLVTPRCGVLPLAHKFDEFPASGEVRIEECVYSFGSLADEPADGVMGPYQGRNVSGPYNYSNDGESYHGNAAEFQRFEWVDNSVNSEDFLNDYLATDTGVVWQIGLVDYKPWITTDDVKVYLRDRGRFFSSQANGDVIGIPVRVWLTQAFLDMQRVSGEETTHGCGTIAYLVSDSEVKVYEFGAIVDGPVLTDRAALDWIARLSRAEARFPGDITEESIELTAKWGLR